ncbi:exonuclease domain-containing protein [uncultured Corynebacterium sp.]|uniref:exonuclease domain-containing protein n=1 Tax=uncultured Corynebacterium sp. TaxID=159447 RepID=UPI0025D65CEC|nr:exonuclease domain-containing protein [uncultured Corynebacterium sp.]
MFGRKRVVPPLSTPVAELELLAVDMETTGVDPRRDSIVSIGWVPVRRGIIDFSGAGYTLVRGASVGESALVHGITDDALEHGADPADALAQLRDALDGKALLAHFAALEVGFLEQALGRTLGVAVVDTFAIERRHMERMGTYPRGEDLRLARVRERYALPTYRNHNALTDAQACAELYLAQVAASTARTLGDLIPR